MTLVLVLSILLSWIAFGQCQFTEIGSADRAKLASAVRQIVHRAASPTPEMIMIATQNGGPPKTLEQMMQYTPSMIRLAKQLGIKPPGLKDTATAEDLRVFIVNRAIAWHQRESTLDMTSGWPMGPGMGAMPGFGLGMGDGFGLGTGQMYDMGMMSPMGGLGGRAGMMAMADMDIPLYALGGAGGMGAGMMGGIGGGNQMMGGIGGGNQMMGGMQLMGMESLF